MTATEHLARLHGLAFGGVVPTLLCKARAWRFDSVTDEDELLLVFAITPIVFGFLAWVFTEFLLWQDRKNRKDH